MEEGSLLAGCSQRIHHHHTVVQTKLPVAFQPDSGFVGAADQHATGPTAKQQEFEIRTPVVGMTGFYLRTVIILCGVNGNLHIGEGLVFDHTERVHQTAVAGLFHFERLILGHLLQYVTVGFHSKAVSCNLIYFLHIYY